MVFIYIWLSLGLFVHLFHRAKQCSKTSHLSSVSCSENNRAASGHLLQLGKCQDLWLPCPSPGAGTAWGELPTLAAQAPKDSASSKVFPCPGLCPRAHKTSQHTQSLALCFKNGSGVLSPFKEWGCAGSGCSLPPRRLSAAPVLQRRRLCRCCPKDNQRDGNCVS